MNGKLNCILLIDDDDATNYYHQIILEEANVTEKIAVAESGLEALMYLNSPDKSLCPVPELIFLDINMPAMNGWEFLNEFRKLKDKFGKSVEVIMLTTSINPDDKQKAEIIQEISGFRNKPLTLEMVREVLGEVDKDMAKNVSLNKSFLEY